MPPKKDNGKPPEKPKPEDLIAEFKTKFENYSTEVKEDIDQLDKKLNEVKEAQNETEKLIEENHAQHQNDVKDLINALQNSMEVKVDEIEKEMKDSFANLEKKLLEGTSGCGDTGPQLDILAEVLEEAWDKLEEFEKRKRSNLIFYGVRGEARETQSDLIHKITTIIRNSLNLKKSVTVSSASRIYSGPKVGSCRPVVVSFEELHAREEVLKESGKLKGSNVFITEDLSRSTRDTRKELERFMREVKRNNPGAQVKLDYDKVEVGSKSYVFDYEEGRVMQKSYGGQQKISEPTKMNQTFKFQEDMKEIQENEEGQVSLVFEKQEEIKKLEIDLQNKDNQMEQLREMIYELQSDEI